MAVEKPFLRKGNYLKRLEKTVYTKNNKKCCMYGGGQERGTTPVKIDGIHVSSVPSDSDPA